MQNRRRSWTLQSKLTVLVLVAIVPGFVLAALQAVQQFERARTETYDAARRAVSVLLNRRQAFLSAAAGLMRTATESVKELPIDAQCARVGLALSDSGSEIFAADAIVDAESRISCSLSVERRGDNRLSAAERKAVDEAAATGSFSEGAYELAASGNASRLAVAYPMPPRGDRPVFLVGFLSIDLLDELAQDLALPTGSVLTMLAPTGIVLARSPNPERWVGAGVKESQLFALVSDPGSGGIGETMGLDGIPRLYAFAPMITGTLAETLIIGIPSNVAFRDARQNLLMAVVGLIASAGVGILAGRIVARRTVVRRSVALAEVARQLAAGELSVRMGSTGGHDEIDQLASAFDDMAAALQAAHEAEQRRYAELLEHDTVLQRTKDEVARQRERLDLLSRELLRAQEKERQHVARELHDHLGGDLTALKINLQIGDRANNTATPIEDSLRIIDRMIAEVRSLSLTLRPPLLQEVGLPGAVIHLLTSESQRCGIWVCHDISVHDARFSPDIELVAFRVLQEALTNAIRHSQAARVNVALHHVEGELELSITDNGRGFDVEAVGWAVGGFGLLSMQERATLAGGRLDIESAPGSGTTIRLRVPADLEFTV